MKAASGTSLISLFSFYLMFYLILIGLLAVLYPFAQEYAKPIAALVFPINESNGLIKALVVTSLMYWGTVVAMALIQRKPQ